MRRNVLTVVALLALATVALAADWPQFRGPARDGKSAETGLLKTWPEGGPAKVWETPGIGDGFASMSVVGGKVYTSGIINGDMTVSALDGAEKGKILWQKVIDKATGGNQHPGSRSTPTIDGDRLYFLSDAGTLICLKAADGSEVWKLDLMAKYQAKRPTWSLAESPLVDGDRLLVTPGGKTASMVALDKMTGKEVWAAKPVIATWINKKTKKEESGPDGAAYASIVMHKIGGVRQAVGFLAKSVFAVNADSGEVLWSQPHETSYDVNATSVLFDGQELIYAVSGYGTGGEGLRLTVKDGKVSVEKVWTDKNLDDQFGGVVLVDGKIYGTGHNKAKWLTALNMADGKKLYTVPCVGQSSVMWADGRLYVQGHDGDVALVDPAEGKTTGQFKIEGNKTKMWAHPVVADGKLYIRHDATISVYDVKAK